MPHIYQLAPSALKDLKDIALYTEGTWGGDQADKYQSKLSACLESIANSTTVDRPFGEPKNQISYVRCEHHMIFYTRSVTPVAILAILHEKMDLIARLKERLV